MNFKYFLFADVDLILDLAGIVIYNLIPTQCVEYAYAKFCPLKSSISSPGLLSSRRGAGPVLPRTGINYTTGHPGGLTSVVFKTKARHVKETLF